MTDPVAQTADRRSNVVLQVPDPTVLTTAALERAVGAERDYVDGEIKVLVERLRGVDTATRLLSESVSQTPTEATQQVLHLRELMDERLSSVGIQFKERDTRSERESRDNKVAVDAAFAAQKEAAAKQDEANQKAIDKSERATAETITKLSELFKSTTDALSDKIDDIKTRLGMMDATLIGIVQRSVGGQEAVGERRQSSAAVYAAIGVGITILLALLTVIAFVTTKS